MEHLHSHHQLEMFNRLMVHSRIGDTFSLMNSPVLVLSSRSRVIVWLNMWSSGLIGSRTLGSSARDVGASQSYWCRNELIVEGAGKDWWLELIIPLRGFWEEHWSCNWGGGTIFHLGTTYTALASLITGPIVLSIKENISVTFATLQINKAWCLSQEC